MRSSWSGNSFEEALHKIQAHPDYIRKVAALTNPLIKLAEDGNNVALSIIQEASHAIANYVISVTEKLKFHENNIVLDPNYIGYYLDILIDREIPRSIICESIRTKFHKWIPANSNLAEGFDLRNICKIGARL